MTDRSDQLNAWVRRQRPCDRSRAHLVVRPDDGRRYPDGSGPSRSGWNAAGLPKGVYKTHLGRFVAKVRVGGRLRYLGTFDTEAEAARAVESDRKSPESP